MKHLILLGDSIFDNAAYTLMRADILETPANSSGETLLMLAEVIREFEAAYRAAVLACLNLKLPLVVCTVYHGSFEEPNYQQRIVVALTLFSDVIIRVAIEHR